MKNKDSNIAKLTEALKKGAVGVLPTDTLYGLVGSAFSEEAVEKIYKLKERDSKKPLIILIGSVQDLKKFEIKTSKKTEEILKKIWPGKVSVIFPVKSKPPHQLIGKGTGSRNKKNNWYGGKKFAYLHRGTKSLAFRLPKKEALVDFLKQSGPLVAPSANREGEKPALNIKKARRYFGSRINFYVDDGVLRSKPSTIITFKKGKVVVLREGAVKVKI
jgi:L-threonylcarbamoyladenylate synthase